jgi:hypothetical protein
VYYFGAAHVWSSSNLAESTTASMRA